MPVYELLLQAEVEAAVTGSSNTAVDLPDGSQLSHHYKKCACCPYSDTCIALLVYTDPSCRQRLKQQQKAAAAAPQ
jgi:hypothetical protein